MGSSLVLNRRPKVPAEDTAAFGAIAERFRRAGALEQAVSLCRDGLKKFPDHVSARVTLGWSLLDLGKYDEARVELEQVMRRAPDNLAAIRGLAELHDRFEHTLNLPMDGPGQWPPPAESVDGEDVADAATHQAGDAPFEVADAAISEFEADVPAQSEPGFAAPDMAPAAMGLPLWTPEPASTPVAAVAPAPVAAVSAPVATSGTGMSSVREIDAFAGAPSTPVITAPDEFESDPPVVAIATDATVTEEIDDALEALIAETESFDAAAALDVVAAPDALELGSVEIELADLAAVEPVVESVAESALESRAPALEPEPAVELASAVELESAVEPEPVLELSSAVEFESALELEPVLESVEPAVELEPALELGLVAEPEPAAALEPAIEIESAVEIETAPELEVAAQLAEVIAFAATPSKSAAKVVALEQMLRRVQTRRRQLMAESVA